MSEVVDAAAMLSNPTKVEAEIKEEAKAIVEGEETKTPADAPKETQDFVSPKLAFLAKEEKRLQEEHKKFQEERKNPEFQEFLEYKKMRENAKSDPMTVLEKLGLTYDEITDHIISGKGQKDPNVRALEDKLAKLERDAQEKEERAKQELQKAQLENFKAQIKEECLKDSEGCELINIYGAHNLVYSVIQEHYDKNEEVLSVQEAAKRVETYLEQESQKYQGSKKLKKLFGITDAPAPKQNEPQAHIEADQSKPITTLSNSVAASQTTTEDEVTDPHELLKRASRLLMK